MLGTVLSLKECKFIEQSVAHSLDTADTSKNSQTKIPALTKLIFQCRGSNNKEVKYFK